MELERFGVTELNFEERNKIDGGFVIGAWAAFWIGVGIGVASIAVYDFINGVYAGIKAEL